MRRLVSSRQHQELAARHREGLQALLEQDGCWHLDRFRLPFATAGEAWFPEPPRDPAQPEAAFAVLGDVPKRCPRRTDRRVQYHVLVETHARDARVRVSGGG